MLLRPAEYKYYFEKLLQVKGSMHQTWKVISSVQNQNRLSLIFELFKVEDVYVTSTDIIVEKFNEYFTPIIGCKLAANISNCPVSYKDYISGQYHKTNPYSFTQPIV